LKGKEKLWEYMSEGEEKLINPPFKNFFKAKNKTKQKTQKSALLKD
jgi:hypothetical protein